MKKDLLLIFILILVLISSLLNEYFNVNDRSRSLKIKKIQDYLVASEQYRTCVSNNQICIEEKNKFEDNQLIMDKALGIN